MEPQHYINPAKPDPKPIIKESRVIPAKSGSNLKQDVTSKIPLKIEETHRCNFSKSKGKIPEKMTLEISRNQITQKTEVPISELPSKIMKLQLEKPKAQEAQNWKCPENPPKKQNHINPTRPKIAPAKTVSDHSQNPCTVNMEAITQKIQNADWEVCVQGLHELQNCAHLVDWPSNERYVLIINRKLIDWIKSPRSSLSKSACRAAGDYLKAAKCTKRPVGFNNFLALD
jgi:hypothetical protein